MNCFYHSNEPAVGICKACSKGLCTDCAADLGHGIACKNKHEQRAEDIELVISRNANAFKVGNKSSLIVPVFNFLGGLLFSGVSLLAWPTINWFLLLFGLGFLAYAITLLYHRRAVWGKGKK